MRATASHIFCSIVMAALAVLPAVGEEPDVSAAVESPWHKICLQGACYVSKSLRTYCGLVGEATLIERKTETGKRLSIGLPTRINPEHAVRITIDRSEPVSRPISTCNKFVCQADYESGAELVEQLKQGQTLVLEAVNRDGTLLTVTMSLAGFAEAYDGPPTPVPPVKLRIASDAEMKAAREQSERAAEERRARCGSSP